MKGCTLRLLINWRAIAIRDEGYVVRKEYAESGEKASERTRVTSRVSQFVGDELERIAREGAQRPLAKMLDLEVSEFLQRARDQRGEEHRRCLNGPAPERTVGVRLGAVSVRVPRVSDVPPEVALNGFHSPIVRRYQRVSRATQRTLLR